MMKATERVPGHDAMGAAHGKAASLHEGRGIMGYVTVIKNKGRKDEQVICRNKPNLLTNAGRDKIHNDMYEVTTRTGSGFLYIALTTTDISSGAANEAAATDTALTGELTSNGLGRAEGTDSHTDGSNRTEIENEFTATASVNNVQGSGLFDSASGGVMGHIQDFNSVNLDDQDTLTVTWQIDLG